MTPPPHDSQILESRGPEPESDGYDVRRFARKAGVNINTIIALLILGGTGFGGAKAWSVGSSIDEAAKAHAEAVAKHDVMLASLGKTQNEVNSKVDVMTSQFTQLLTSQGELRAAQVVLGKSQEDLRMEIASLKASGTENKVRDMDGLLRQQGEKIAKLEAILEREKK
jgi:hypothetical protein